MCKSILDKALIKKKYQMYWVFEGNAKFRNVAVYEVLKCKKHIFTLNATKITTKNYHTIFAPLIKKKHDGPNTREKNIFKIKCAIKC